MFEYKTGAMGKVIDPASGRLGGGILAAADLSLKR